MRLVVALIVALSATGASAQGIDCVALRSGDQPFEITYAAAPASDTSKPVYIDQVFRGAVGVTRSFRRFANTPNSVTVTEHRHLFTSRIEVHSQTGVSVLDFAYEGIALTSDPFASWRDLAYTRRIRSEGQPERVEHTTARFTGEDTITIKDCAFPVLVYELERRRVDPGPGEPATRTERIWHSTELRTFLRFTFVAPPGSDNMAQRIATGFTPFR